MIEGAWEEVARHADQLAGKWVRLIVIENGEGSAKRPAGAPFYATATPAERARAWEEWCHLPRPYAPPLSDEAISRESIYSPDED
jgi:hypothetical protein